MKDGQVNGSPLTHDMGADCLEDLKDAQEAADCLDPQRIEVEIVNYLTGPLRLVGVHVSCGEIGPWGAFDKTVELLQMAKDKGWKLCYIFVVGCCGTSVSDKDKCKEGCPCGTVLFARQVKDYLNTGKGNDGQVDGNPLNG